MSGGMTPEMTLVGDSNPVPGIAKRVFMSTPFIAPGATLGVHS